MPMPPPTVHRLLLLLALVVAAIITLSRPAAVPSVEPHGSLAARGW